MADYYPLIAKAVAGLEKNTGESRRTLYERARSALVAQLRSVTPALSETEITRERLALEEAIRRVEADAARRARFEGVGGKRGADLPPRPSESGDLHHPGAQDQPGGAGPPRPGEGEPDAGRPLPGRRGFAPRSVVRDQGPRGFREGVAGPEDLGNSEAPTAAKATRDAPRFEPQAEPGELRLPPRRPLRPPLREPTAAPPEEGSPRQGEAPALRETARSEPPKLGGIGHPPPWDKSDRGIAEPTAPDGILPDDERGPPPLGLGPLKRERPRDLDGGGEAEEHQPPPYNPAELPEEKRGGVSAALSHILSNRSLLAGLAALALVLCIGGILVWQWPTIAGLFKKTEVATAPSSPAPAPAPAPATQGKLTDRVGAPGASSASKPGQAADVAQRVVLYEEDPNNRAGQRHVGTVVWHLDSATAAPGQTADPVIRADIEIPDPHITVKWSLRRNTDKALPASHTIEIVFTLPPDFANGTIANIPGILMKQAEQTRGVPLAGLSVKVTAGFFLIGLSSTEIDVKRNIQLLKERAWFDIPIVYSNGRRAILALEKGNPGDRIFEQAFAAWGE